MRIFDDNIRIHPLAGANIRPAVISADGDIGAQDAATFLGTIGAAASAHGHSFASLTSKPTTLSGYGIADGQKDLGETRLYRIYWPDERSSSTSETAIGSFTIPANTLTGSNQEIAWEVYGRIEQGPTSDTMTVRFKVAGSTAVSIVRTGSYGSIVFRAQLRIRANSSNCRVLGEMFATGDASPTLICLEAFSSFAAGLSNLIEVTAQSDAGNVFATLYSMDVKKFVP